jgi:hypothetical protein
VIRHPFDAVKVSKPAPPPRSPLPPIFELEMAYQLVMVACLLELVLTAFLLPRGDSNSVVAFQSVAALRLLALLGLCLMVLPYKTRFVLPAMLAWGAILAAPELWSFALEARAGMPMTLLGSPLLVLGIHGSFRLHSRLWVLWLLVLIASCFTPYSAFLTMIEPGFPFWTLPSGFIWLVAYWRNA